MPNAQLRCCPDPTDSFGSGPLTYVDPSGYFFNMHTGTYMLLLLYNYSDPTTGQIYTKSDIFGKCIRTQSNPTGYGPMYDPIDCPCCPDNYQYVTIINHTTGPMGTCASIATVGPVTYTEPIPCISCVCPDPPPPPVCESCEQSSGQPINFSFRSDVKQCKDCIPQDFILPNDAKFTCFAPYFLILPNLQNFKLD